MGTPNYPTLAPACPGGGTGGRACFTLCFSMTRTFILLLRNSKCVGFTEKPAQDYHSHFGREPALPGAWA